MSNWYRNIVSLLEGEPPSKDLTYWFGKSVMTDNDGRPLVFHHFTHTEFDVFDRQYAAKKFGRDMEGIDTVGIWFTSNDSAKYGPNRMDCYLKVFKPYFIDDELHRNVEVPHKYLGANGRETRTANMPANAFNILHNMIHEAGGTTNLRERLKASGYDAIVLQDTYLDGYYQDVVIVFDNNQIKSVSATRFDSEHESIHESDENVTPAKMVLNDLEKDGLLGHTSLGLMAVEIRGRKEVYLDTITSENRGSGNGSIMLKGLLNACDKHGVTVKLIIGAYPNGLTEDDLIAWYMRNGFKQDMSKPYDIALVRKPKKIRKANS